MTASQLYDMREESKQNNVMTWDNIVASDKIEVTYQELPSEFHIVANENRISDQPLPLRPLNRLHRVEPIKDLLKAVETPEPFYRIGSMR